MFILDAWKLYNLRKVEMKIKTLFKKKEEIILYLKSIEMLPSKYEINEQQTTLSYSFSINDYPKDDNTVAIDFKHSSTQEIDVVTMQDEPINTENIAINSGDDVNTDHISNEDKVTCLDTFKVRIVSIDLEREIVYVQKWTDLNTQISESNLIDIFVEEPLLKKLPIGEHAELTVLSNNNVIFAFDNGEKIAC